MKKKLAIVLLALVFCLVTACSKTPPVADALKADLENAKANPEEIVSSIGADAFGEEATSALVDKILEFEYEIGEEKVDGDSATVELTVTTYPFGDIFTDLLTKIMSSGEELANMTEDELNDWIGDTLTEMLDGAEKTYTETISVPLELEDDQWVVQEDEDFANAITGGMMDFANSALEDLE